MIYRIFDNNNDWDDVECDEVRFTANGDLVLIRDGLIVRAYSANNWKELLYRES